MRLYIVVTFMLVSLLGGCQAKQIRHLASDAAMITPGQTTRQEVTRYLGEPDARRTVSAGVEEYVYYETKKSDLARLPLLDRLLGTQGYEILIITIKNDKVTGTEFRTYDKDDAGWSKDFTWEEIK